MTQTLLQCHTLGIAQFLSEHRGDHFFMENYKFSLPIQHLCCFHCAWLYENNCFNIYLPPPSLTMGSSLMLCCF